MSRKRILIFSLTYYPVVGGAEVALKELTDRLSDMEFDMITLRFSKEHKKEERVGNVNVYRIGGGLGYLSKILFVPQAAWRAHRLHDEHSYSAFWAMMTYMTFPIMLARMLGTRAPYIITLQDGDPFTRVLGRLRIIIFSPLLLYGFRHADKVQTISNFLSDWARELGYKGEVEVIPNGVDVTRFKPTTYNLQPTKESVRLITTSRLVEKNGVGDIIQALKYLPSNVALQILGVGPLESELKRLVQDEGLGERVEFLGHVEHEAIPEYLHEADVFVRPSLSEGQGISFIEAMASGLPVVATPVGGIPDFLTDGETGLLCTPRDPKSIAEAVERLISEVPLRERVISKALKMVEERYEWDLITCEMRSRVFDKV